MKNILLILLFVFSAPAFAAQHMAAAPVAEPLKGAVNTVGYAEKTPEATLEAIRKHYAKEFPTLKGDAFVDGSLNFNKGSAEYNQYMTARMSDEFDAPVGYAAAIAAGKSLWETPFTYVGKAWDAPYVKGMKFADCFPNGGKGAANQYPRVNQSTGKVITFEGALNKCLEDSGEKALNMGDMKTMGALTLYPRSLSNGERIKIEVKTDADKAAFNRGKEVFYGRVGNFEQACAHCHIQKAGNLARTEELSPVIGQAAHWPVFRMDRATDGVQLISLQKRYEGCQRSTQVEKPIKPGSDASNDLEYFHTYLSTGLPFSSGIFRK